MRFRLTGSTPVVSLVIGLGSSAYVVSMPDVHVLRAVAVAPTATGPLKLTLKAYGANNCLLDSTGTTRIVTVRP